MLQSISHAICFFHNFHIKNVYIFHIVRPQEVKDLPFRVVKKMVACVDKNILFHNYVIKCKKLCIFFFIT